MRGPGLAALTTALLLVGCGSATKPAAHSGSSTTSSPAAPPAGRLSVSPPAPTTRSDVTFAFAAPATAGRHGASLLSFALTLAGPRHAGCVGPRTAAFAHAAKGATASVRLGGPWCAGAYSAQVQEFARPFCRPGQMCPQYVRLVATVAAARFRIAAG
jgi:hypothetical protein